MARRSKAAEEDQNAIDLTPMLDVVFIMLIFFIVTASFIKEPGIEVNRPEATTSELKKNASILIAITGNNEVWIDKQRIDVRAVKNRIERLYAENPKGTVVIQADDEASIELMTKVAKAATEVGVIDVSVSTEKK
jgi:biopolymer transport protein ExbD